MLSRFIEHFQAPSLSSAAFSDGTITGSIARAGSFKGSALRVPNGCDVGLIAVTLRGKGIFVEGPIVPAPAAAALETEEQTEDEEERRRREEEERPVASAESMARRRQQEDEERRRGQK